VNDDTPGCRWHSARGRCGNADCRPYPCGLRCDPHSPWALAGQPEPLTPTEIQQRQEQQCGTSTEASPA
jgi:hypothetical protein